MAGLAPELGASDCLIRFCPPDGSAFLLCPCLTTVHASFDSGRTRRNMAPGTIGALRTCPCRRHNISSVQTLPSSAPSRCWGIRSRLLCGLGHFSYSFYICLLGQLLWKRPCPGTHQTPTQSRDGETQLSTKGLSLFTQVLHYRR